ncbi:hypothetical protein F544_12820 [Bibersteinia trehalosi USDA-ARS-USMARC-190]|uniref:Lipoprotein n=1 Tax=Bibersteinia trehalosi USDA-ARS-USMARC-190 TaxID=1263832 RepID=W0R877_BIBTR|nr:hypothetical protein [Bibersteinia trehalosi]AHG86510.1 hypothetical protein F544_12820 [Bibersteinia trehalosi USDA-ARS-USMARC-190]
MQYLKLSLIYSAALLTGCQSLETFLAENFKQPENKPVAVVKTHSPDYERYLRTQPQAVATVHNKQTAKPTTKRINTTQCRDSDDWYIDGYRVGKSFANQQQQMYQQRLNYCGYTAASLPTHFKQNWQRGFHQGIR